LCFGWHLIFCPSFIVHPTAPLLGWIVHDLATNCREEKRTLTWAPQACLESPRGRQGKMQVGVRCRTCVYLAGKMQALAEVEEREGERRMGAMKADAEDTSTSAATIRSVFPCIVAYAHTPGQKRIQTQHNAEACEKRDWFIDGTCSQPERCMRVRNPDMRVWYES